MTNKEMAVTIAKDVLLQLKVGKLKSQRGTYINIPYSIHVNPRDDFREQFNSRRIKYCEVCALGALLIGYVDIHNEMSVEEIEKKRQYGITETLHNVFSTEQLTLIERVFEGWGGGLSRMERIRDRKIALFKEKYKLSHDRLIAIMRNIIRNKGEFKFPRNIERKVVKITEKEELAYAY